MARKQKAEDALRAAIAADPAKQAKYGDAWDAIAKAHKGLAAYAKDRRFIDLGAGFNTSLFTHARNLVRLAEESEKPNADRLPEFTDARRSSLEGTLFASAPFYEDFEKMKLANSLTLMRDTYGANHQLVQKVLKGKTPEARAAELIDGSKLQDVEFRQQLAKGGKAAIEASNDPMIQLARSIDKESRIARKRYEDEVLGVEGKSYAKIAHALFETEGTKLYPDATFTLRLSYGAVKGYTENGKFVAPFTTLGGLYARSAKLKKFPWVLPPRWIEQKSKVNPATPFNFVSTNDIVGGNSGSPTINKNRELVGLMDLRGKYSIAGRQL